MFCSKHNLHSLVMIQLQTNILSYSSGDYAVSPSVHQRKVRKEEGDVLIRDMDLMKHGMNVGHYCNMLLPKSNKDSSEKAGKIRALQELAVK